MRLDESSVCGEQWGSPDSPLRMPASTHGDVWPLCAVTWTPGIWVHLMGPADSFLSMNIAGTSTTGQTFCQGLEHSSGVSGQGRTKASPETQAGPVQQAMDAYPDEPRGKVVDLVK